MPIYAYRCLKCGAEPEFLQKMSEPPIAECEACGGELVRKVTAAAFHLKGGGWYKDGYASSKPGEGGDKGGDAKSDSKTETKSDAGAKSDSSPAPSSSSSSSDSSSKPSSSSTGGSAGAAA